MPGKSTSVISVLILVIQILAACSTQPGTNVSGSRANGQTANSAGGNSSVTETPKDNVEELSTLIKMPFEPEDLVWKEFDASSTSGKQARRLLAVLQFSAQDTRKLVELLSKAQPGVPVIIPSEVWYPKELTTQSEMGGDEGIKATSFPANDFFQPPYLEGTIARVDDTDFFVLELFAK